MDNRRLGNELERIRRALGPELCEERSCAKVFTTELVIHPDGSEERIGNPPPPLCERCPERSNPEPPVRCVTIVRRLQGTPRSVGEAAPPEG